MLTTRTNVHRSVLPRPGSIVIVKLQQPLPGQRYRKFQVESFPVTDSPDYRYSIGIHTCTIRALDNGEVRRIAGHWLEEL